MATTEGPDALALHHFSGVGQAGQHVVPRDPILPGNLVGRDAGGQVPEDDFDVDARTGNDRLPEGTFSSTSM
jgi:hypothetical protein